ncbi:hypothetical protein PAXINDRAFT_9037 [Paxillus involutus ATCC 200175]|nr:hypothetical protein PAXINDRAFT_9037 [Paxillus involutus ATCC 200175]
MKVPFAHAHIPSARGSPFRLQILASVLVLPALPMPSSGCYDYISHPPVRQSRAYPDYKALYVGTTVHHLAFGDPQFIVIHDPSIPIARDSTSDSRF